MTEEYHAPRADPDVVRALLAEVIYADPQPLVVPPDSPLLPPRQLPAEDRNTAERLAGFNRRGRHAFWSVRRHGGSEADAFAAAQRTLPR